MCIRSASGQPGARSAGRHHKAWPRAHGKEDDRLNHGADSGAVGKLERPLLEPELPLVLRIAALGAPRSRTRSPPELVHPRHRQRGL